MKCDIGRLEAFREGELSPMERAAVEAHLSGCPLCREELMLLERQSAGVARLLSVLDPEPNLAPAVDVAWARFMREAEFPATEERQGWRRSLEIMKQTIVSKRWRPAFVGMACLLVLVGVFNIAPVREAAAEFLGVFRVRKFAAIPVDVAKMQELEGLEEMLNAGLLGEPTVLREPGEPVEVENAQAASELAGYAVRMPSRQPDWLLPAGMSVAAGPALQVVVDSDAARAVLAALGVQDVSLPEGQLTVEADFGSVVTQAYRRDESRLEIMQMPAPEATIPGGIDAAVLGKAWLRLLGLPEDEAERLSQVVDWTSTLVIPIPTELATYREVEVNGATGLAVETRRENGDRHGVMIWQRDGFIFAVSMVNVSTGDWLFVADSLE